MQKAVIVLNTEHLTPAEINERMQRATNTLNSMDIEVISRPVTDEYYWADSMEERGVIHPDLCYLAGNIEAMTKADCVLFCDGWEDSEDCQYAYSIAVHYGLGILNEVVLPE